MATVMRSSILFCARSARSPWGSAVCPASSLGTLGPAPWSGSIYSQSIRIVFSPLSLLKACFPSVFPRPAVGADRASRIQWPLRIPHSWSVCAYTTLHAAWIANHRFVFRYVFWYVFQYAEDVIVFATAVLDRVNDRKREFTVGEILAIAFDVCHLSSISI